MDTTAIASRDMPVAARPGYDATPARTVARVRPMLAEERVVWLSTVRPDGTPHLVPTWFLWDGEALVVFSKPGAAKVRNLRANPRLMVAVGDPEDDFAVGLIEAAATCLEHDALIPDAFFAKYAGELGRGRLDAPSFRATYTQTIRIVPTRYLQWHGRGEAHAGSPTVTAGGGIAAPRVGVLARLTAAVARILGSQSMSPAAA
jgi:PPOX class probable F420-dependent enzyme